MVFYLTYNDAYSGIYSSQVIDVVRFLNVELNQKIKLVAIVSLRIFFNERLKIKNEFPDAIILPMFPGINRWRKNSFLLWFVTRLRKPSVIIGRSVIETQLALIMKDRKLVKKVIYDGRGAITEEWREYGVVENKQMLKDIFDLECRTVLSSDSQIAVSEKLVQYWRNKFGYIAKTYVLIPCTLNNIYQEAIISDEKIIHSRKQLNLSPQDTLFIYSGSIAGWQSFNLLYNFAKLLLEKNIHVKLLFLTGNSEDIIKLQKDFPGRILWRNVPVKHVPEYLIAGDYGLLIREETLTNNVASPVKFAEYLACGLKVIISKNLGDYSHFVKQNRCGQMVEEFNVITRTNLNERLRNQKLAQQNFTKSRFTDAYRKILVN